MIYTSYYGNAKNLKGFIISISNSEPFKVQGKWYDVVPEWNIVSNYKKDKNEESFREKYIEQLESFDLSDEIEQIKEVSKSNDIYLVCYEKPNDFCHRHILADWLNEKYNLNIKEFKKEELDEI